VAQKGDHGVRKVLADALAADDGLVDGRIDARGARLIIEVIEEALIQLLHSISGSSRA